VQGAISDLQAAGRTVGARYHLISRSGRRLALTSPASGRVAALEERSGWGNSLHSNSLTRGGTPLSPVPVYLLCLSRESGLWDDSQPSTSTVPSRRQQPTVPSSRFDDRNYVSHSLRDLEREPGEKSILVYDRAEPESESSWIERKERATTLAHLTSASFSRSGNAGRPDVRPPDLEAPED